MSIDEIAFLLEQCGESAQQVAVVIINSSDPSTESGIFVSRVAPTHKYVCINEEDGHAAAAAEIRSNMATAYFAIYSQCSK